MTQSRVAITPGHGVVVRRSTAVLFDPTGQNKQLVAAFEEARDDVAAARTAKQTVIDRGFGVHPFVMISWGYRLEMLVFGDCELRSTAPSAPMLSGARSGTWVEHNIEPQDFSRNGTISIWCGHEVDPVTNLRLGVANCDGINVTLSPEQAVAFQGERGADTIATGPPDAAAASAAPSNEPAMCEKGHTNPPNSSACFTCGGMIGSDATWSGNHASPGQIMFPEGTTVAIDRPIRLGRQPTDPGDGTLPITIHHENVAPDHAQITVDGWAVLLTDLGSETGTFVFAPDATSPIQLQSNTPHVLEAGTSVQLGAAAATFVYDVPSDDE